MRLNGDVPEVFRAVITYKYEDGTSSTSYHGPFAAKAAASAAITKAKKKHARQVRDEEYAESIGINRRWYRQVTSVEGVAESAPLNWRPVA